MSSQGPPGTRPAGPPAPNLRLKAQRARLGLTQAEVAQALAEIAWQQHGDRLGVDATMVSKWERGLKRPRKLYRNLLCSLYGSSEEELGFHPPRAGTSFYNLGDDVKRREFLQSATLLGIAAVNPLTVWERLSQALERPAADEGTVAAYESISAGHRGMYWTTPAPPLFESSTAHTQLGLHLLRTTNSGSRQRLTCSVAQAALLSARLAFFDLANPAVADPCLNVARELAEQSEDHALIAAVYGHMAFVPGFAGHAHTASAALDSAHHHARRSRGPRLSSWLHCVSAEIGARTGDPQRAVDHARRAEDALSGPGLDPTWLDFYDASRLAGFTGYVQLRAGDQKTAATTLEAAVATLPASATKQHSVLLLDLATAYAANEPEHAVELVTQAVTGLRSDWYATARDRIPAVQAALEKTPYRSELQERLKPLAPMVS